MQCYKHCNRYGCICYKDRIMLRQLVLRSDVIDMDAVKHNKQSIGHIPTIRRERIRPPGVIVPGSNHEQTERKPE